MYSAVSTEAVLAEGICMEAPNLPKLKVAHTCPRDLGQLRALFTWEQLFCTQHSLSGRKR